MKFIKHSGTDSIPATIITSNVRFFKSANYAIKLQEGIVQHLYSAFLKTLAFQRFSRCTVLAHTLLVEEAWICIVELLEVENSKCESCKGSTLWQGFISWCTMENYQARQTWNSRQDEWLAETSCTEKGLKRQKWLLWKLYIFPVVLSACRVHQKQQFLRIAW